MLLIPKEIHKHILEYCGPENDYLHIMTVSKYWNHLIISNNLFIEWKNFCLECNDPQELFINRVDNTNGGKNFNMACKMGYLEVCKYLLKRDDVNINDEDDYALKISCEYGRLYVVKWFVKLFKKQKWTSDSLLPLFMSACFNGHLETAKYIISLEEYNAEDTREHFIHFMNESIFVSCCEKGYIDIAKWLIELGYDPKYGMINIHIHSGNWYVSAFSVSCMKGNLDIAKWLISLGEKKEFIFVDDSSNCASEFIFVDDSSNMASEFTTVDDSSNMASEFTTVDDSSNMASEFGIIDIHEEGEYAFEMSCSYGHLDVAKWLIELGKNPKYGIIDIHSDDDYAFRVSCMNKQYNVVDWLIELGNSEPYTPISQTLINTHCVDK
jgi:ankyrin repeat protein